MISIVEPAILEILVHVPIGPDLHEVVAPLNGNNVYVSNTGSVLFREISVINLVA
jgi:DNA-binding beta-propeller fold protein YncE